MKQIIIVPLFLITSVGGVRGPGTANADDESLPPDLVALARLDASDTYESHVPSSWSVASELDKCVEAIRGSADQDLRRIADKLIGARQAVAVYDTAIIAAASEAPLDSAVRAIRDRWLIEPGADQQASFEIFQGYLNRFAQMESIAAMQKARSEPVEYISNAWFEHGLPKLETLELLQLEAPIRFELGLIQDIAYGRITSVSETPLTNVIIVVQYTAKGEEGHATFYCRQLENRDDLAVLSPQPVAGWGDSMLEQNSRNFNKPLKDGRVEFRISLYCDQGRCDSIKPTIKEGLTLRGNLLKAVLRKGAAFRSADGGEISIDRVNGRSSTLQVYFNDGAHVGTIRNSWMPQARRTDFEPHSTAFRITLSRAGVRGNRNRGPFAFQLPPFSYEWRGGFLIFGQTIYLPVEE